MCTPTHTYTCIQRVPINSKQIIRTNFQRLAKSNLGKDLSQNRLKHYHPNKIFEVMNTLDSCISVVALCLEQALYYFM